MNDILGRKDFSEPPEVAAIKDYVQSEFQTIVGVLVNDKTIVIEVPSAALANTLRLRTPQLQRLCQTDKRLVLRIS